MGEYKAKKNNQDTEEQPKTEKEEKQEATAKAVDVGATMYLDSISGGMASKVKNIPGVNGVWNNAVNRASKLAAKTPVGDVANGLNKSGITDAAKSGYDAFQGAKSGNTNGLSNIKNKNNSSKTSNLMNGLKSLSNGKNEDGVLSGLLKSKQIPLMLKIKIIAVLACVFLGIVILGAILGYGKDFGNLLVTDASAESINNTVGSPSKSSGDMAADLETVGNWFIGNVNTYQKSTSGKGTGSRKYYQTPFGTRAYGDDCSEFSTLYMSYICGVDLPETSSAGMIDVKGSWANNAATHGWKAYTSDQIGSIDNLRTGDVLIANSGLSYSTKGAHAEIFITPTTTFGWGRIKTEYPSSNSITASNFGGHIHFMDGGHDYVTIYRYEG